MNPFGPVFVKELLEVSRRRRYFLLRVLLAGAMFVAVMVQWEMHNSRANFGVRAQAKVGEQVFQVWIVSQAVLLGFLAPIFTAGLIASERERGSLDLLFTTQLSAREIVFGKLASRLTILWLVLVSAAPVIVALSLFGGVGGEQMVQTLTLSIANTVFLSSVGLYYSTRVRRPWIAVLSTVFFFAVVWIMLPALLVFFCEMFYRRGRPPYVIEWILGVTNVPLQVGSIVEGRMPFRVPLSEAILVGAGLALASSAFFVWRAIRSVRVEPRRTGKIWPVRFAQAAFAWIATPLRRFLRPVDPRRFLPHRSWEVMLDRLPIAWRNLKADVFDPNGYMSLMQWTVVGFLAFAMTLGTLMDGRPPGRHEFPFFLLFPLVPLQVFFGILLAGSISRERERGSMDLLWMAEIRGPGLALGNLWGAFANCAPLIFGYLGMCGYGLAFDVLDFGDALSATALLGSALLAFAMGALLISTASARVLPAVIATVALGVAMWLLPIPLMLWTEWPVWPFTFAITAAIWIAPWNRRTSLAGVFLVALTMAATMWIIGRRQSDIAALFVLFAAVGLLRWADARTPMLRLAGAVGLAVCVPLVCQVPLILFERRDAEDLVVGEVLAEIYRARFTYEPWTNASVITRITVLNLFAAAGLCAATAWKFPSLTGRRD